MERTDCTKVADSPERGHLMVGLVAAVAIMMILSLVAEQLWKDVLRRDREAEMIFRAQDIVRALRRYRVDNGGKLPLELKAMMEPGPRGSYYLRKLWKDPLVKDGKWGLLYASPQGGYLDPNAPPGTDPTVPIGGLNATTPAASQSPQTPSRPAPSRLSQQQSGSSDESGTTSQEGGSGGASPGDRGGSLRTRFGMGAQEMTGLPIIGVKSLCKDRPFRVLNDQTEYAMWRFTVLDLDQPQRAGAGVIPQTPVQGGGAAPGMGGLSPPGGSTTPTPTPNPSRLNPQ